MLLAQVHSRLITRPCSCGYQTPVLVNLNLYRDNPKHSVYCLNCQKLRGDNANPYEAIAQWNIANTKGENFNA